MSPKTTRHHLIRIQAKILALCLLCLIQFQPNAWAEPIRLPSGVKVDLDNKKVMLPIKYVCHTKSGLEFILTKGMDKDYEALLSTNVSGADLHMALLMIGLEPNKEEKKGSPLDLSIQFHGKTVPLEKLIVWSDEKAIPAMGYFFRGSRFIERADGKKNYAADISLNIIGAWDAIDSVISPSVEVGNPYDEDPLPHLNPHPQSTLQEGQNGTMIIKATQP